MSSLLVFNRVYILEIKSVMLVFSTGFVNYCPLTFSLVSSPSPPPTLPCVNKYTLYMYTVCKGGGSVGPYSYEGRGPQTDKTPAAKSLYRSIFLDNDICIAFYQSNLPTAVPERLLMRKAKFCTWRT
jgi:hypothetical protein